MALLIAGHGKKSGTGASAEVLAHNVYLLAPDDQVFCVGYHNIVSEQFASAKTRDGIQQGLALLTRLPSTTLVSRAASPFQNTLCKTSTSMLEHKIFCADELLLHQTVFQPWRDAPGYVRTALLQSPTSSDYNACLQFNVNKVCQCVRDPSPSSNNLGHLSSDHAVYLTLTNPAWPADDPGMTISHIVHEIIPKIRILVVYAPRKKGAMDQDDKNDIVCQGKFYRCCATVSFLDDGSLGRSFLSQYNHIPERCAFLLQIPVDIPIVLMTCRHTTTDF
jgi:hypothetical protein